ncbi:hypothetical protein [Pseudomonas lundensis]|uniref:hypothetical protein n=1 Tax=Pseudomonas lundensis TaxID=86185 RepID=UPI0014739372|nr:hypothetical protein [Pseudomonas lundensis]NNA32823.1 hypothetical protein [Pseudomonas lundensis]
MDLDAAGLIEAGFLSNALASVSGQLNPEIVWLFCGGQVIFSPLRRALTRSSVPLVEMGGELTGLWLLFI